MLRLFSSFIEVYLVLIVFCLILIVVYLVLLLWFTWYLFTGYLFGTESRDSYLLGSALHYTYLPGNYTLDTIFTWY